MLLLFLLYTAWETIKPELLNLMRARQYIYVESDSESSFDCTNDPDDDLDKLRRNGWDRWDEWQRRSAEEREEHDGVDEDPYEPNADVTESDVDKACEAFARAYEASGELKRDLKGMDSEDQMYDEFEEYDDW